MHKLVVSITISLICLLQFENFWSCLDKFAFLIFVSKKSGLSSGVDLNFHIYLGD